MDTLRECQDLWDLLDEIRNVLAKRIQLTYQGYEMIDELLEY